MKIRWSMVFVLTVLLGAFMIVAGCDCGGDDDDDDDDLLGDDDNISVDCTDACDSLWECGGVFWYSDKDECVEYCNDWEDTAADCAACFFDCFEGDPGCLSALNCLYGCAEGPCLEELEELDDYL